MTIYLILLLSVVLLSSLLYVLPRSSYTPYVLIFLPLVLVAGLRDVSVGTDSVNYVLVYSKIQSWSDIWGQAMEPGYLLLSWLGNLISNEYATLFLIVSILTVACYLIGIKRYSAVPSLSLYIYIATGTYTFFYNGLRQGLAMAVIFLAMGALYEKRVRAFSAYVVAASFFHLTAIIMFPAYFLISKSPSRKLYVLILVLGLITTLFFGDFIELVSSIDARFSKYSDYNKASGMLTAVYHLCLCLFFLYFYKSIKQFRFQYSILLNMYVIGTSIVVFALLNNLGASGIARIGQYFFSASLLLWPIIYRNLAGKSNKLIFVLALFAVYFLYYYLTTKSFSNLVPYKFNQVIFSYI